PKERELYPAVRSGFFFAVRGKCRGDTEGSKKRTAMHAQSILVDLEGVLNESRSDTSRHSAMLALLSAKNPEPLVCRPGGVAKTETSRRIHQARVTKAMRTVALRITRTVQRLYGETCFSHFGLVSLFPS